MCHHRSSGDASAVGTTGGVSPARSGPDDRGHTTPPAQPPPPQPTRRAKRRPQPATSRREPTDLSSRDRWGSRPAGDRTGGPSSSQMAAWLTRATLRSFASSSDRRGVMPDVPGPPRHSSPTTTELSNGARARPQAHSRSLLPRRPPNLRNRRPRLSLQRNRRNEPVESRMRRKSHLGSEGGLQ